MSKCVFYKTTTVSFLLSDKSLPKNKYSRKKNLALLRRLAACVSIALVIPGSWAADSDFNAALNAANSRNLTALEVFQLSMQDSVLGYYPEYWKLNNDLSLQPAQAILGFVNKYQNSAMAEKLAADYVEAKVQQGDFASAKQLISSVDNPDDAEACAIAQVQASNGDELVLSEFKKVWLTTSKQSDFCDGLNRFLLNSPLMTAQDRQQRLWTMLRANQLGSSVNTAQSIGISLNAVDLSYIAANPLSYLQTATLTNAADQARFLFALARLADTSVDVAAGQLESAKPKLPADVTKFAYRILAYKAATSVMQNGYNPKSVAWFEQSDGYPFSDEEAEAYARQAVRFSQWNAILKAVDAMSLPTQQQRVWQYWYARANDQMKDERNKSIARAFYTNLALEDDYYGLLSRDKLGQKLNQLGISYTPSAADYQRLDFDPNFRRAFSLRNVNASAAYANREWNWAVRQARLKNDDGMILAAASRANSIAWYDRAIYAAERTVRQHNYALQFLTPYREEVVQHSGNVGIDPAWVYGLIRQESRFVIAARSHVGAGGLMQIMPDTAKWVAKQLSESYSSAALSHMQTNIRYGTYYLSHIQSQLSSQPVLATAGYNAGPNRAKRWQPVGTENLAADQYTEAIPLLETRDYVKNVMTNSVYYALLFGQGPQSISKRMGEIPTQLSAGW